MSDINLLISVSRQDQVAIEEYCINMAMSVSEYFIKLHHNFQENMEQLKEIHAESNEPFPWEESEFYEKQLQEEDKKDIKKEIKKKKYGK